MSLYLHCTIVGPVQVSESDHSFHLKQKLPSLFGTSYRTVGSASLKLRGPNSTYPSHVGMHAVLKSCWVFPPLPSHSSFFLSFIWRWGPWTVGTVPVVGELKLKEQQNPSHHSWLCQCIHLLLHMDLQVHPHLMLLQPIIAFPNPQTTACMKQWSLVRERFLDLIKILICALLIYVLHAECGVQGKYQKKNNDHLIISLVIEIKFKGDEK